MPHQQRLALLCTSALLACGAIAARADAAPVDRTPVAAPPPALVAPTDPFRVTTTSPTTARMVGTGADAGLSADVEVVGGTFDGTTAEFWSEIWRWIKSHIGGGSSSTCTSFTKKTITVDPKTGLITVTETTIKVCTT